ncbi:hypothetical protein PHYBOEH_000053 [Phytophthora boehmeriae]|uniref:Uncharacterized protein n=1 Tax=Phytophthora boehmeriae TaxID=109152 RepID=A0A8T1X8I4_9STRA|nr:hypothetical protein PHYBOEH_000053 [Phytophthora boehmeriae]
MRNSTSKAKANLLLAAARILEVLGHMYDNGLHKDLDSTRKGKKILKAVCRDFVSEYEYKLTRFFFDDFTPAKKRMCVSTLQVCTQLDKAAKFDEL